MSNVKSQISNIISIDIILFCYRQEQYIEQALRSIYAQELPKDVNARIIVADDASPDNTLAIIKRLAPESPFPMTFLSEEPNMGISKNYKRSFAATEADYVAILEGDDYWLPNHLAQHIEFLCAHPECSMSMNEISYLHEHKNALELGKMFWPNDKNYALINVQKQISEGNQLGNLSACIFRGQYLRDLLDSLFEIPIADWIIGIMLALRGDIAILKGSTSVYRFKESGVWAGQSRIRQHFKMLHYADMYDRLLGGKYHAEWKRFKCSCWRDVRRNWMHYMPHWLQKWWHKIKK